MSDYDLKTFQFGAGKHKTRDDGLCIMEAVAYLAGEEHSDHPACASPVIGKLAILVNDYSSDIQRNLLLRDMPWRIVGTRDDAMESKRAFIFAEWFVTALLPSAFIARGNERAAREIQRFCNPFFPSCIRVVREICELLAREHFAPKRKEPREIPPSMYAYSMGKSAMVNSLKAIDITFDPPNSAFEYYCKKAYASMYPVCDHYGDMLRNGLHLDALANPERMGAEIYVAAQNAICASAGNYPVKVSRDALTAGGIAVLDRMIKLTEIAEVVPVVSCKPHGRCAPESTALEAAGQLVGSL